MPRIEAETDRVQISLNSTCNSACTQQSVSPCDRIHNSQCPEGFGGKTWANREICHTGPKGGEARPPLHMTTGEMTFEKAIEEHDELMARESETRNHARFLNGMIGRRSWAIVRDSIYTISQLKIYKFILLVPQLLSQVIHRSLAILAVVHKFATYAHKVRAYYNKIQLEELTYSIFVCGS